MKINEAMRMNFGTAEEWQASGGVNAMVSDIVDYARNAIINASKKPNATINYVHPSTLITLIVANITINLASGCITAPNTKDRLLMVDELSTDIKKMICEAWQVMETADVEGEKH